MPKRILIIVGLLIVVGLVAVSVANPNGLLRGLWMRVSGRADKAIRVSGNIEVTDAEISFKIAGRVVERLVDEGELVATNQVIARLDTSDLKCDVDARQAEVNVATAALAELRAGSRPQEVQAAKAAMDKAEAAWRDLEAGSRPQEIASAEAARIAADLDRLRLQAEFRRAQRLVEQKVISQEDFDRVKAAFEVAIERVNQAEQQEKLVREGSRKQQIEQAKSAFDQAKAQYELVLEGPRKEQIQQAEAKLEQAKAALALAKTRLGYAEVQAPFAGVVLSKSIEPGEYVAPGTAVVTIGDLVNVWLRAYINEQDLDRVKVGQRARVTIDSRAGKAYEGRVSFIASQAEFTPKNVQTEKERIKLVYRIKIDIKNPAMELKPGMPADAEIEL